jgi:methionine--tRNA ligase beta chain
MATSLDLVNTLIETVRTAPASQTPVKISKDCFWDPVVPCGHTGYSWGTEFDSFELSARDEKKAPAPAATPAATPAEAAAEPVAAAPQEKKQQQKKPKQPKQPKQKRTPKPAPVEVPPFWQLNIQVGLIKECKRHPDAQKLYVEQIDLGEESGPREILSGLVDYIPIDQMIGTRCLVISNLKPANMRGITSYGMVLCASDVPDKKAVHFVTPPADAPLGARVYLEGATEEELKFAPSDRVDPKKKNHAWMKASPGLASNAEGFACFEGRRLVTAQGVCSATPILNGKVS